MTPQINAEMAMQLIVAWTRINARQFRGSLRMPALSFSDAVDKLGSWDPRTRTLELSRRLLTEHDWLVVLEVLRHEMAHQYVSEVLKVSDERAHGAAFQRVCADFGIDPSASGTPSPGAPGAENRVVGRIRALLALADSPNEHEARAAARKAYALMHQHNVELVGTQDVRYVSRRIGPVKARFQTYEKSLAGVLGAYFFVTPVWTPVIDVTTAKPARALLVMGRPDNLAMAEHVYSWLLTTGERLFEDYKRRIGTRSNKERRRFLLGVVQGFSRQLNDQQSTCQERGLVWVGDAGLDDYVHKRFPRLVSSRRSTFRPTDAWRNGLQEGTRLDLKRPVTEHQSNRGRQITGS